MANKIIEINMSKLTYILILVVAATFTSAAFTLMDVKPVKCLIQLKNYKGEGAYIVVSLLNPSGKYEETLYVQGKEAKWYKDVKEWWSFYGKKRSNVDAITGATVKGGERSVVVIKIPEEKIDKGYQLRFESAVEDQEYHKDDVLMELTTENLSGKLDGKGFIRYVKLLPQ